MLQGLPDDVLQTVFRLCDEAGLASLSCTNMSFSHSIAKLEVWKTWCLHKWPACQQVVDLLGQSWQRTYGVRRQLPSSLPSHIDNMHLVTEQARLKCTDTGTVGKSQLEQSRLFSQFMQQLLGAGLVYSGWPGAAAVGQQEHRLLRSDVAYWMEEEPAVVIHAVRSLALAVATRGPAALTEAACARTALDFLTRGRLSSGHSSVLDRLTSELGQLDACIRQALSAAAAPAVCRSFPAGVPPSHWWWGNRA